ncbi:hypothetical protein H257_17988 [Aphanomyces astaci]|uniref:Uncharacterized protein n=1 Tax=Aphanomyces astaci TaxID=112090 RepID=W4FEG2_APHAT|nr:hypothetical protein H257_17988 [Aphanomyces astaci]ETV65279.1 hypothetical protein H257_17988 [Aphanomyces astaci]|eukprot:XP_009845280.1 hypothetical protein H257_17988 [Aphanomyces astaci]
MFERFYVQSVSDQLYLDEKDNGIEGFRTLTNFTPDEFKTIWSVVVLALQARWNDSSGRKPTSTPKNAFFMSPHEPGSVSDLAMFRKRLDVHVTKPPTETAVNVNATGGLDRHDLERNAAVSADRVNVENFFSRMYDGIQRLTFALMNFHVGHMTLREDDRHQYCLILVRYACMGEEKKSQRTTIQCRYVLRRAERRTTVDCP